MKFLVEHALRGHAEILLGNIASQGWLELLPIRLVTFKENKTPASELYSNSEKRTTSERCS
jgi:hypothetical protein